MESKTFVIGNLNYEEVTISRIGTNGDIWSISSSLLGTDSLENYTRISFENGTLHLTSIKEKQRASVIGFTRPHSPELLISLGWRTILMIWKVTGYLSNKLRLILWLLLNLKICMAKIKVIMPTLTRYIKTY